MDKDFFKGIKIGLGFIFIIGLVFGLVFAAGLHTPPEILSGTFIGDYIFSGDVDFNNNTVETTDSLVRVRNDAGEDVTNIGQINGIQVFQPTAGADALMTFHVSGDYAVHFGLDGETNDLTVGGWSKGANKYKIWHEGNLPSPGGGLVSMQVFTSSGTWTKPAGVKRIHVKLVGGGGGGGAGISSNGGCGGGAGGYSEEIIDVSAVSSVAVTVGAGGAGSTTSAAAGTGGTTSFGAYLSGAGGTGGIYNDLNGVYGGWGSGGDLNLRGGMGDGKKYGVVGGAGGASYFGGGGSGDGSPANAYGAGGGGGNAGTNGGNGANGVVIVYEYS